MSRLRSKFLCQLLEDSFGVTVKQAVEPLLHHGPLTLPHIAFKSTVPLRVIKQCLQILIQHNIVSYSIKSKQGDVIYHLDNEALMSVLDFPRYCSRLDRLFGRETKVVFAALLRAGRISVSKLIFLLGVYHFDGEHVSRVQVMEEIHKYYEVFQEIAKRKYVIRCDKIISSGDIPEFSPYEHDQVAAFKVPEISFDSICNAVIKPDSKLVDVRGDDEDILWRVNRVQFSIEFQTNMLGKAMAQRTMDSETGTVFEILLSLGFARNPYSDSTPSVGYPEIKFAVSELQDDDDDCAANLNDHLKLLISEPLGIVVKTSDQNGGQYSVCVKEAFRHLAIAMVEKIVENRFGSQAARLFRIVRRIGFVEQDKLIQNAMMSTKFGRSILYRLVEANFVSLKEVRKSYTIASSMINKVVVFVFCLDFETLLRTLLEDCYQASINARTRQKIENEKHKRLLLKESRIEKILFNMKKARCTEAQLDEVRDMLTYPERKILSRAHQNLKKLSTAQLHTLQTMDVIKFYFQYHS